MTKKNALFFQKQQLKIYLFSHQEMKPLNVCTNFLKLVILFPSTTKCERCFSANTSLKTQMEQATLSDLPRIKAMDCGMKDFDPSSAMWHRSQHGIYNLVCPRYNKESEGGRTFLVSGIKLWNCIHIDVKKKTPLVLLRLPEKFLST